MSDVASISIRDSQRQRVYDSEALAFEGITKRGAPFKTPPDYQTVAECQEFVNGVVASPVWRYLCPFGPDRVTVADGRGRRRAAAFGDERVAIPKFARRRWVLLHELAHLAIPSGDMAAHGPQYVSAYLYLAAEFLSAEEHAALVSAMATRRVKICDYMGSGVYDSTTVRHVTVVDTAHPAEDGDVPVTDVGPRCLECGMVLAAAGSRTFCSDRCRWTYHNRQRHERTEAARQKTCEVCGTEFPAKRSDAKTCSLACKQKAHRQRRARA